MLKSFHYICVVMGKIVTIQIALVCFLAGLISAGNNAGVPSEQKQERMISSVETNGSWVYLYDAKGNKYKTLTASYVGEVKGYSSTFFVSRNGSWIYLWDSNGNKYKTLTYSYVGDVIGVAGDTFTSRNGSWIYTWNSKGDKINTRTAH